jgi:predicted enzyme related to lactoylglutathione lyase
MIPGPRNRVVHLELRTPNAARACGLYTELFGWRVETVRTSAEPYVTLDLGGRIDGGVAEHDAAQPFWLPYVEVPHVAEATRRAEELGAATLLPPREGPAGWRSVVSVPSGGVVALWQPKC